MKYRIAIQVKGAISGLVTADRSFATDILDRLTGAVGIEWLSFEASASGVFTPLEEGIPVVQHPLAEGRDPLADEAANEYADRERAWLAAGQLTLEVPA